MLVAVARPKTSAAGARTRLPRQILIRGNACGLPGATRETASGSGRFSTGCRAVPGKPPSGASSSPRSWTPRPPCCTSVLTGKRSVRSSMSYSKSALSLLKRLREMVLGVPALIAWHTLAARAGVPTPAIQAIARRPRTRNGTRRLAIHRAAEQRCLLRRGTCRFYPVRVRYRAGSRAACRRNSARGDRRHPHANR